MSAPAPISVQPARVIAFIDGGRSAIQIEAANSGAAARTNCGGSSPATARAAAKPIASSVPVRRMPAAGARVLCSTITARTGKTAAANPNSHAPQMETARLQWSPSAVATGSAAEVIAAAAISSPGERLLDPEGDGADEQDREDRGDGGAEARRRGSEPERRDTERTARRKQREEDARCPPTLFFADALAAPPECHQRRLVGEEEGDRGSGEQQPGRARPRRAERREQRKPELAICAVFAWRERSHGTQCKLGG